MNKLLESLPDADFHSNKQYGLVKGKSTIDSATMFIEDLKRPEKYRAAAFLDIKAPFDNVWFPMVISSLNNKNI